MKILITTGLFPPDIGGPATYVPRIAEALAGRGHDVTAIAPQDRGVACPIIAPPYQLVRFHRARALRYANFFVELWRAFVTVLRKARACDVMFVNGLDLAATIATRLTGKPMVVKVVGDGAWEIAHNRGWTTLSLDEFSQAQGLRIGLFRLVLRSAAKHARAVIVPSRYLARIVEEWGVPGKRIGVVYNAFASLDQKVGALPDVELPQTFCQGLRLIVIGRLVPHKRVASIIQVLVEMQDARLIVVGDGPEWCNLQSLIEKLGLTDRVFMTGRLSQQKTWGLLARYADALVLNSTYEGLPHILLEAAYFGVPIVATAVGGTPEVVQDEETGLLISPDSPNNLLTALQRLQADPDLRRRLAANARHVATRFSFGQMVDQTEQVLQTVCSPSRSG
jgi:glycosyltransferase involved in cell wall biosynthesis